MAGKTMRLAGPQLTERQQKECVALFYGPDGGASLDSRSAGRALWTYASLGRKFGIFRSHARLICIGRIHSSRYLAEGQVEQMRALYNGPDGQGGRLAQSTGRERWTYARLARRYKVAVSVVDCCLNRGPHSPRRHLSSSERRHKVWVPGQEQVAEILAQADTQCPAQPAPEARPPRPKRGRRARADGAESAGAGRGEGALAACR